MARILIATICLALGATHALAVPQAPQVAQGQASTTRLVPHSGVLTDAAGHPLTGIHTVTFTLFDHAEGGTALWTDTVTVTADARGRYAAYLGAGQMLPLEHFSSEQARWVEASVNGHADARVMLVSVPYALKAADAETLGGKPVSSFLTTGPDGRVQRADGTALSGAALDATAVDGSGVPGQIAKWSSGSTLSSSVITETATNRIGVGLPDPTGGGVVDSVFSIKNLDNNTGFAILNETQQRRFALNTQGDGGWLMYDGGSSTWNPGLFQVNGRVGVGTTAPNARIHAVGGASTHGVWGDTELAGAIGVIGQAFHTTSTTSIGVFGRSIAGFAGSFVGPKTYVSGNLGVGTSVPLDKLDVRGDIRVGTGTTGCVKDADGSLIAGACSSDVRFKKNISPFAHTLGRLTQLQPVYFDWRADEFPDKHFGAARSFGLIAQDVEAVLPELVVTDEKGYKAVKYNQLPFHMLQAIKELKTENDGSLQAINELRTENAALQQQLRAQEERLRRLEARK